MASAPTVAKAASTNDDDSYTAPPTPIAHTPGASRPPIVGDDSPSPPYPIYARGKVTRGFGRGSKELGCPTANLPDAAIAPLLASNLKTGVHFGFAKVDFSTATGLATGGHDKPLPMVMSVGWNPQYANERRTAEVHILHEFPTDFYGHEMAIVVLGFIRPEYKYDGLEALIEDIETDKRVAQTSLDRPAYTAYLSDLYFAPPSLS